jgi:hypothetical protein
MLVEGPFGMMLSGGTNLDSDDERLFIADNTIPYYDGEDTSTMLAPIYGACTEDYAPWRNYQRFGRSLFCENYQAETDLRTWFASAPLANDGTAILASLSGAVSQAEMIDTARTVIRFIDTVTGSLWWWPSGWKECRKLTRCSQGQGAWAWQYKNRWLGIETDALSRTLTVDPKGLPSQLHIYPSKVMGFPFDLEYDEIRQECTVRNISSESWNINVAFRKYGCGAEGERDIHSATVAPHSVITLMGDAAKTGSVQIDTFSQKDIVAKEIAAFGREGILFVRRGGLWYWLHDAKPPFDLRFVVGNGTTLDWKDTKVTLRLPEGCLASAREQGMLVLSDDKAIKYADECICHVGGIGKGERKTASFLFYMPRFRLICHSELDQSRHLLADPLSNDALITTLDINDPETVILTAVLESLAADGKPIKRVLEFKAGYMPYC